MCNTCQWGLPYSFAVVCVCVCVCVIDGLACCVQGYTHKVCTGRVLESAARKQSEQRWKTVSPALCVKYFLHAFPMNFAACCCSEPENADLEPYSVHAVAAAVGGFFRELPEPLLTRDMYMEFLRAMGRRGSGCG